MSSRIVFMGTPDFAAVCLARLLDSGFDVAGVFCQPDRPKGRGYNLAPPPVKRLALERGLPVFQPVKMRDGEALSIMRELNPDIAAVVAYGRILPPELLAAPRLGCVNLHASLLPKLRGAAPIQWAVINGETVTGVTSMHMAEGLDTGDMILQRETPIGPDETTGELFERLAVMGADCLAETLELALSGSAPGTPQNGSLATWAPPIEKAMAALDFTKPPEQICNLIRGLNPSPTARAWLDGKLLKVLLARPVAGFSGEAGKVLDAEKLIVGCGNGAIKLVTVQPEGKKPMSGADFARGRRLAGGEMFTTASQ